MAQNAEMAITFDHKKGLSGGNSGMADPTQNTELTKRYPPLLFGALILFGTAEYTLPAV